VTSDVPEPSDAAIGTRIAGYLLEEQIGRGGMAVVYRALDERLDRRVALKLLAPSLAADAAFQARFIRESRAAAAVDHPNIIPVYDAGDAGGSLFIVMRYVEGGDVRSLLRQAGPLPPARVWRIITQVAAALDAAHARGLIHRDVKPANMLLDASTATGAEHELGPDDRSEHVYLADFGISKQTLSSHLTSTGQFVGTLDYVAPEQIEGGVTDGRADQYSLACAAFELLSGIPPFRRDQGIALLYAQLNEPPPTVSSRRPGIPAAVDPVLAKALAKSPAERYATCAQFAADLGRALHLLPGEPGAGRPLMPSITPAGGGTVKPWPATELAAAAAGGQDQFLLADTDPGLPSDAGATGAAAADAGAAAAAAAAAAAGSAGQAGLPESTGPGTSDQGAQQPRPPAAPGYNTGQPATPTGYGTGQPGSPAPGAYGTGQPATPTGQPAGYGTGQPAGYAPGQPAGYGTGQPASPAPGAYDTGQPTGYGGQPTGYAPGQPGGYGGQPGGYGGQPGGYGGQPGGYGGQPGGYAPGGYDTGQLGGYGTGTTSTSAPQRKRGSLVTIFASIVVLVVAIAAAGVIAYHERFGPFATAQNSSPSVGPTTPQTSTSPSTSPTPTPTPNLAASEAGAVNSLLTTSAASRQPLQGAVTAVMDCSNLGADVAQIQAVVNQRSTEYNKASALDVGALPNGAVVKNDLRLALLNSLDADQDYLAWAQAQQTNGCPSQSSAYSSALTADGQAEQSKNAFVLVWNPIAATYGFPQASASSI
jgi:tRNA A-37 threonylcarbamoyl transferase component Bud32